MANEQLVADLECILEDVDNDQEIGYDSCLWEDEEQLDTDTYNQVSSVDVAATPVRQHYMTTLKKDCSTRWNCLLSMMDSLLINQHLIERCLARLRLFDKMCSEEEWKTIANVVEFLKIFKTATEVLSSALSTPTLLLTDYY